MNQEKLLDKLIYQKSFMDFFSWFDRIQCSAGFGSQNSQNER